jgi:hypothetical protein
MFDGWNENAALFDFCFKALMFCACFCIAAVVTWFSLRDGRLPGSSMPGPRYRRDREPFGFWFAIAGVWAFTGFMFYGLFW